MLMAQFIAVGVCSAIFDCEFVNWDYAADRPEPFSTLQRLGQQNVDSGLVHRFRFPILDLLVLDGRNLLEELLRTRKKMLQASLRGAELFLCADALCP